MPVPELPLTLVTGVERVLRASAAAATSPFTGTQQIQDWGGRWWEFDIDFAVTQGDEGRRLSAFYAGLGGIVGTFLFRDPAMRVATSTVPLVKGAGQTGSTLLTDGWGSTTLKAGAFFSLGSDATTRLYQLLADVTPSGGNATLSFAPALRATPADNAPLNIVDPAVLLRLKAPVIASIRSANLYRFTASCREAI
jgi:hypothetical protein